MQPLTFAVLEPVQSKLLCEGIFRVYGDTYPIAEFYEPSYVYRAMRDGLLHSVVGVDEFGRVQACMSTLLESGGERTADGSALMVAPEFRDQGVVAQLAQQMVPTYEMLGLSGLHLYALALHGKVQSQSGAAGACVTGILPAWFSRRTRVSGYDYPDARIGAVSLLMPLDAFPGRSVYLPSSYAAILTDLYGHLPLEREFSPLFQESAARGDTQMQSSSVPMNQQRRLFVQRAGSDFAARLQSELASAAAEEEEVCYLDIAMSDPGIDFTVATARSEGFFFGGLLVERGGTDRLRLQRYAAGLAAPQHMVLASDEATWLMQVVLDDQASVSAA